MAAKCAHDPCQCTVEKDGAFGKYCSASCEMKGDSIELKCDCNHAACK